MTGTSPTSTRWRCRAPAIFCIEATAVEADRPHHAGLPRPLERRHRSGAEAGPGLGAQALEDRRRDAARPCRPQGVEPHAVGRRPADPGGRRRLADGRALGHAAQGGRDAAAGVRRGGPDARARGLRRGRAARRSGSASTRSRCTPRTAICCISSCRRSPTSAPTQYGGSLAEPHALSARSVRRGARGVPGGQAGRHPRLVAPTGSRAAGICAQTIEFAQGAEKARRRLDRCVLRRRLAAAEDSARPRLPGAVRAGDQGGDRASRPSRSA